MLQSQRMPAAEHVKSAEMSSAGACAAQAFYERVLATVNSYNLKQFSYELALAFECAFGLSAEPFLMQICISKLA